MRVTANGCELHVSIRGAAGPSLVFLHYFAGSARAWDGVVSRLGSAFRCVAPDLRGFGRSSGPDEGYAVADGASDVEGMIDQLGISRYLLVGHSMGGKIALALAARRPRGLLGLALVAPSPPSPEPIEEGERARLLAAHGNRHVAEETAARIVARPLGDAARRRVVGDNLRTSRAAWRAWLESGSQEDIAADAAGISVPTLVACGDADRVLPPALLEREVVGRIPGARMVVLPGVGHLVPLEAPAELATLITGECARRS